MWIRSATLHSSRQGVLTLKRAQSLIVWLLIHKQGGLELMVDVSYVQESSLGRDAIVVFVLMELTDVQRMHTVYMKEISNVNVILIILEMESLVRLFVTPLVYMGLVPFQMFVLVMNPHLSMVLHGLGQSVLSVYKVHMFVIPMPHARMNRGV